MSCLTHAMVGRETKYVIGTLPLTGWITLSASAVWFMGIESRWYTFVEKTSLPTL